MAPSSVGYARGGMTALEQLFEELYEDLESSWNERVYDLGLAATLSPADRATFVDRLRHEALRGNKRAIRTLLRLDERSLTVAALKEQLGSEHYPIRMRAWEGLVEAWELMPRITGPDGRCTLMTWLEQLHILIASDILGLQQLGVAEMRTLVDRLAAGESPESLGIVFEPSPAEALFAELRGTLFDPSVPFPVHAIAKLTGGARRMAEIMIALRFENGDPRVVAALTALHANWALACLPATVTPEDR